MSVLVYCGFREKYLQMNIFLCTIIFKFHTRVCFLFQKYQSKYLPAYIIAKQIGLSSHVISRFTGTIYVNTGCREDDKNKHVNVGLNLRFNKTGQEVKTS